MTQFTAWLTSLSLAHLVAIIALVVLLGLGTITTSVGLPLLAGVLGLSLPVPGGTSKSANG